MSDASASVGVRPRIESVDVVRGVIMIIMALDHTRDFFGMPGQSPTNMSSTYPALFFTRWITHFCAPVFFLLTGTGAFLSLRKKSTGELSRFLLTRGIWMIVLEAVVVRCLAYQFNIDYKMTILMILWTLGWSMIVLSVLIRFSAIVATVFGVVLIIGHNLFDGIKIANPIWTFLHAPGFVLNTPDHTVFIAYPIIPWIAVTAVGFALGQLYNWDAQRRRAVLLRLGAAMTVAFVALRAVNIYGDPNRWSQQQTAMLTFVSFLNATKQPPSLLFLLMTLGPALMFLAFADRGTPGLLRPALVYGKVPLFYFVLHFFLIHTLAVVVCGVQNGAVHWLFQSPDIGNYPFTPPPGWGFPLPIVYAVWVAVVITLFPLCRWFAGVKQRRRDWWLSYL